jgi:hypothetical protein
MTERTRRYPQRPLAFWAVFAVVAAVGFCAASGVGLMAVNAKPVEGTR